MQMFDPSGIRLGAGGGGMYMPTKSTAGSQAQAQQPKPTTLGAEAVRGAGTGPYDNAYRQNLATYAGGFSQRPGGYLGFNPTGNIFGNPTGGGTAPVPGGPTDLLTAAMGGQGFSTQLPPSTPQTGASTGVARDPLKFWLNQYQNQGNPFRGSL